MNTGDQRKEQNKFAVWASVKRLHNFLATRAYTLIIVTALIFTLSAKLYYCLRFGLINKYPSFIFADVASLMAFELIISLICSKYPKKFVLRIATIIAAVICTWSVLNAGWIIRTGNQILPHTLLPLFRSPVNAFIIIGYNLAKMPVASIALLLPSALALIFFFAVLAQPKFPVYNEKNFKIKIGLAMPIILLSMALFVLTTPKGSIDIAITPLRYNAQIRAVMAALIRKSNVITNLDIRNAKRIIPSRDQVNITASNNDKTANVVIIVLEGIQHQYTSLYKYDRRNLTPYLKSIAEQGAQLYNTRSILTHTTKALFSILTGHTPSCSQDIVEAVPVATAYASLATILEDKLNYRTAFFQSAKGDFEARPGLVHNLGYQKFWAREDYHDPNAFVGSLGCDEFAMIEPISEWINASEKPFFLTVLCSVTHDPYDVPKWYSQGQKPSNPLLDYYRAINYTDDFIKEFDRMLGKLQIKEDTIFCIIGDHGEAFGEHGFQGHERIAYEEALRVPWILRAPKLIKSNTLITTPASSFDVAPTLFVLLGFDITKAGFDGKNVLSGLDERRKLHFTGWMTQSPAGYVVQSKKYIYFPSASQAIYYDLKTDPKEYFALTLDETQTQKIAEELKKWRKNTLIKPQTKEIGNISLYDNWQCRWYKRTVNAKLKQPDRF